MHDDLCAELTTKLSMLLEQWHTPGLAITLQRGSTNLYSHCCGVGNLNSQHPVTSTTRFYIGSVTKTFSGFAAGQLVDAGLIDWDTPIHDLIPEFKTADLDTTCQLALRDMLSHRTGLADNPEMYDQTLSTSRLSLLELLPTLKVDNVLGTHYAYNNCMYGLVGTVLECLSGQTWEAWLRQNIFGPLDMLDSDFSFLRRTDNSHQAVMYRWRNEVYEPNQLPAREVGHTLDVIAPAGSINTCINDLEPWLAMLTQTGSWNGQRLIKAATLNELWTAQIPFSAPIQEPEFGAAHYGLGWVIQMYRGQRLVWHDGAQGCLVMILPESQLGVAVLANRASWLPFAIALHLLDQALGHQESNWLTRWVPA